MRRILIWGRVAPLERRSVGEILLKNGINSNSGNLFFVASVARTLSTQDALLVPFFREDAEKMLRDMRTVDENYDAVAIPLANAFRPDYRGHLRALTRFLRATRLPCWVIGVGMQAQNEAELFSGRDLDADARAFVSAALERSALLGLRGAYTARYLEYLGFREGRHYRIIGCPSAYLYGPEWKEPRVKPSGELRRVGVSFSPGLGAAADGLIREGISDFDWVCFVPQRQRELWSVYFGCPHGHKLRASAPDYYPARRKHPFLREGRVAGFVSAQSWIDFMGTLDFAFGSRIHGSMAAVLAGTPALAVACDLRVQELAEYHGIPHILREEIQPGMRVRALYESADFGEFGRRYPRNFQNYVDFLNAVGAPNIYADPDDIPPLGEAPYDRARTAIPPLPAVVPGMRAPMGDYLRLPAAYARMLIRRHGK